LPTDVYDLYPQDRWGASNEEWELVQYCYNESIKTTLSPRCINSFIDQYMYL
jgi:hypothetical protein